MNKKLMIAGATVLALALGAFARPHGPGFYHGPRYHGGFWGRGGCNFWPGFVGGVVGSALYDAVTYPRYASSVVVTPFLSLHRYGPKAFFSHPGESRHTRDMMPFLRSRSST